MTLLAAGCLTLLLAHGPAEPDTRTLECKPKDSWWCGAPLGPALPSQGGTDITRVPWGFSVRMETGPTVRVGGLATRDACWRVHKTLHDAHPEWVLGDCEEGR